MLVYFLYRIGLWMWWNWDCYNTGLVTIQYPIVWLWKCYDLTWLGVFWLLNFSDCVDLFVCAQRRAKEVALLDKPALMKKLRGLLGDLSGRVAGRNKDDVSEALITVCSLLWFEFLSENFRILDLEVEVLLVHPSFVAYHLMTWICSWLALAFISNTHTIVMHLVMDKTAMRFTFGYRKQIFSRFLKTWHLLLVARRNL